MFKKFKYIEPNGYLQPSGTYGLLWWKGNSIYDPSNVKGSAGVPGQLEWMGLFRRYQVFYCAVKVRVINMGTLPCYANLRAWTTEEINVGNPTQQLAWVQLMHQGVSSTKMLNAHGDPGDTGFLKIGFNIKKLFGHRQPESNISWTGTKNSDPELVSRITLANCFVSAAETSTTAPQLAYHMEITYYTKLWDRVPLYRGNFTDVGGSEDPGPFGTAPTVHEDEPPVIT